MPADRSTTAGTYAGYHDCPCRDCFEIAIGEAAPGTPALCHACADAGCDADGDSECCCEPDLDEDEDCAHTAGTCPSCAPGLS